MRLDHRFTVPAPIDEAWRVLLDLPRIAPCMPGASLTEFDGEQFTGTVKVKLGPVSLTYKGKGRFTEVDESAHRAVISASGKESRGSGTAAATITATLVDDGDDTTAVNVVTELTVTGRPAQFGRGMLADVGDRLLGQFSECLATKLGEAEETVSEELTSEEPVSEKTASEKAVPQQTVPQQKGPTDTAAEEPAGAEPAGAADPAGGGGSGDSGPQTPASTGETPSQQESTARTSTPPVEDEDDVEPIDLLEVTGAGAMLRKYAPAVAGAAVAIAAVVLLIRAILGRRKHRD